MPNKVETAAPVSLYVVHRCLLDFLVIQFTTDLKFQFISLLLDDKLSALTFFPFFNIQVNTPLSANTWPH